MDIWATPAQPAQPVKPAPLENKATSANKATPAKLAPLANKATPATPDPLDIRVSLGLMAPTAFSEPLAIRDLLAKLAALDTKATRALPESWVPTAKTVFWEQLVIKVRLAILARRARLALRPTQAALDKQDILALALTLDQPAHKVRWGKMGILGSAVPKVIVVRQAQLANKVQLATPVQRGLSATLARKVQLEIMVL
jgi:hypothetical protein